MPETSSSLSTEESQLNGWLLAMRGLADLCKAVANRSYYVQRGPIDWASWDFEKHPKAISILCDERSFMSAINATTITLEMFRKMGSEPTKPGEKLGLSDAGITAMSEDAKKILTDFVVLKRRDGDSLVTKRHTGSDSIIEASDSSRKVEGIVATIKVDIAE